MVSEVAATEAVDLAVDSEVEHAEASAVHSVAMVVTCEVDISRQIMLRMQVVRVSGTSHNGVTLVLRVRTVGNQYHRNLISRISFNNCHQ